MNIKYGMEIRWTKFNGTQMSVVVKERESFNEAVRDALGDAVRFGWTQPKWWQWWRRNDTKIEF